MVKLKSTASQHAQQELKIELFAPGMTGLHRVGLAGLWMTLNQFEKEKLRLTGGSWKLTNRSVTLRWDGHPRDFFQSLFQNSFKLDRNGLLWFAALGNPMDNPSGAVVLNEAVLGTFLQHGNVRHRKADPSNNPSTLAIEVGGSTLAVKYRKIKSYPHQYAASDFISDKGQLQITRMAGWHFPGGAVRHVGLGGKFTALEEPPGRLLPLLYAPVGGIYFQIHKRGEGVRPSFALVIPDVFDLEKYSTARAAFLKTGIQDLQASGTADAGWRVLTELHAKKLLNYVGSHTCRVISFGTVPWSKQQKTRVELFTVKAGGEERLRTFNLCRQAFRVRLVKSESGEPFWDAPQVPELIARNLAEGRPWYENFGEFITKDSGLTDRSGKRLLMWHVITAPYREEKGGLNKMVDEASLDDERERILIRACHKAWQRRMGQLGERARKENASFPDLVRREFERLRVGFSRCKNASAVREALTDFWARAGGPIPDLASGWKEILPLLKNSNWKQARDLALLALASYQPESKEEEEALSRS